MKKESRKIKASESVMLENAGLALLVFLMLKYSRAGG
jgi:hypothetical protein